MPYSADFKRLEVRFFAPQDDGWPDGDCYVCYCPEEAISVLSEHIFKEQREAQNRITELNLALTRLQQWIARQGEKT